MKKNAYIVENIKSIDYLSKIITSSDEILMKDEFDAEKYGYVSYYGCLDFESNLESKFKEYFSIWYNNYLIGNHDKRKSIYEILSGSIEIAFSSIFREYYVLKYWLLKYNVIYIPSFTSKNIKNLALYIFKNRIKEYSSSDFNSCNNFNLRFLLLIPKYFKINLIIRFIQKILRINVMINKIFISNQVIDKKLLKDHSIIENSKNILNGAYHSKPDFNNIKSALKMLDTKILQKEKHGDFEKYFSKICDSHELYNFLHKFMAEWVALNKKYLIMATASYINFFDFYRPKEVVLPTITYEPYFLAALVAKSKKIKVSWLTDGIPTVDLNIFHRNIEYFDSIYYFSSIYDCRVAFIEGNFYGDMVEILPPSLTNPSEFPIKKYFKYDYIIMTYVPYDINPVGRNTSRVISLKLVIDALLEIGCNNFAIKVKTNDEIIWVRKLLIENYQSLKIDILYGKFLNHLNKSEKFIGGLSSAVAECISFGATYYIFEPLGNGYTNEDLLTGKLFNPVKVARNKEDLVSLLLRSKGSTTIKSFDNIRGARNIYE